MKELNFILNEMKDHLKICQRFKATNEMTKEQEIKCSVQMTILVEYIRKIEGLIGVSGL